ncbi:MAG TPA: tetratricopeptide repeat protein [Thermoanaerobaculia bacterium]|nr:tetratricopeptide repeat protein [Thermoanaerobaculia bacterium]
MVDGHRQGAEGRIAAAEEARRRVAREIHDNFSQRLAALALSLKAARKGLPEGDPGRAELDGIGGSLADLGEDLRRLSHDLHPAALERRGLAVALCDHGTEVERRQGLRVDLSLEGSEGSFPPEIALGLYRIVQEALANTVRHAGAKTASVALRAAASGTVRLTVTDDGRGFDPDAARRAGGLGLASLEERAQVLGGRCQIQSAPGAGTRIEVAVPLPATGALAQLREQVRRHRRLVASTALVILALAAGLVTTLLQARRARQEAARADASARFLEGLFEASDPRQARGRLPDARELLRRGSQRLGHELRDQPLLRARLLDTLGGIDTELGLYDDARPLLAEALALRERLRGRRDPEVADTLVRLGSLARLSGQGDAIPLFRRALAIREDRLGPADPAVADVLGKLGTALAAGHRLDEAEATLHRALALDERLWGANDPRVAKVLHNLSGIAYYRDDMTDYERLLQRALAIREAALPADDLDLAGSREALALLRLKQDRPAEAAQLLERLAATYEKIYGPQHPQLAKTLVNLGLARADLHQNEAARQLFERALAITERGLTPAHPQHVRALATLANFHFARQRCAEARPLYQQLLALHDQGAPYDDWDQVIAKARRCGVGSEESPPTL